MQQRSIGGGFLVCLGLVVSAEGQSLPPTTPTSADTVSSPPKVFSSGSSQARIEPVILTRAVLDDKIVTLHLAPHVATSIRLPEPVNSIVLGDPEHFQAEHSEHERELVTVKPIRSEPAQTNLLISTTLGNELNLLLISGGEQMAGTETVDVLLHYGKPTRGSFLVEEAPFASSFIAETKKVGLDGKALTVAPANATTTREGGQIQLASFEAPKAGEEKPSSVVLDKLLERQRQAPLPVLYGQKPGQIEAGPRVKAGVSEVLDEGKDVVVLFSVLNPAKHVIEITPPQVQLGGKLKKKWTTAEQLSVVDYRLSTRRVGAGQRADGVMVFERPGFKQSKETLFLQIADSGAVDLPALAPIGFGISSFRGGSAYEESR